MSYSNNTSNVSSSDGREIGPVDMVYTAGEVMSALCLAIIIITYTLTKRRQTVSGRLMINFCLSLLLLYAEATCNKFISASGSALGCVVIGVIGHWMFLAMLAGLATYSLWIYLKLAWVFTEEPHHYIAKAAVVTWVAPLIVALISVAPDYQQYRRTKHLLVCKAHGYALYLGLLLPSLILFAFVLVIMVLSLYKSQCSQDAVQNQYQTEECAAFRTKLKRRTRLFLGLLIMVVLGWGSALIASDENTPTAILIILFILFLFCGFGQGVYLFLFVCVFNSRVRRDWKEMISHLVHFCKTT